MTGKNACLGRLYRRWEPLMPLPLPLKYDGTGSGAWYEWPGWIARPRAPPGALS
jgi:hypothetical protein